MMKQSILFLSLAIGLLCCRQKRPIKEQSIRVIDTEQTTDSSGDLSSSNSLAQLNTSPGDLILTGFPNVRLVPIIKVPKNFNKNIQFDAGSTYDAEITYDSDDDYRYYMPGIDIVYGYNLVNIAHYNLTNDSVSYFFKKPVLIKTLYFPGVFNDSLGKKAVSRNFFLVSAYNEDSNHDSLINKKDYRNLFYIDQLNSRQISLLPPAYSAISSDYDFKNDLMIIRARKDANGNGNLEPTEPIALFALYLNNPTVLKKIYE